jgi:hypothetical protein
MNNYFAQFEMMIFESRQDFGMLLLVFLNNWPSKVKERGTCFFTGVEHAMRENNAAAKQAVGNDTEAVSATAFDHLSLQRL